MSIPLNPFSRRTNGEAGGADQRCPPRWDSPDRYLHAVPAAVLLNRLPVPMLAFGHDGFVRYHNPAFAVMLGHGPDVTLAGYGLPALLDGHSTTPPPDCVAVLRAADNTLVDWHHAEGFPVRSVISEELVLRAGDEILLFGVTDLTELVWMHPPDSAEARDASRSAGAALGLPPSPPGN